MLTPSLERRRGEARPAVSFLSSTYCSHLPNPAPTGWALVKVLDIFKSPAICRGVSLCLLQTASSPPAHPTGTITFRKTHVSSEPSEQVQASAGYQLSVHLYPVIHLQLPIEWPIFPVDISSLLKQKSAMNTSSLC